MDETIIIITLVAAVIGFWVGFHLRAALLIKGMSDNPDHFIKLLEQVKRINEGHEEGADTKQTTDGTELFIERVGTVLYAYIKDTNQFVSQGDSLAIVLEEAEKRDHRKLGQELDLFVFSDLVGSGLPMFTPRGTILRDLLNDFSQSLRLRGGFEKVWIPHLAKIDLYKASGHWDKFGDELFLVKSQESNDEFATVI